MIEVMLDLRGKTAGTRVRSFAWSGVRALKMAWGKFTLEPAAGKKQLWRVPLRGDRKILEAISARLRPRLLTEGAGHAAEVPLWHCPQCVAVVPREPESCVACRTRFRSKKLASILSIAFPGAGLFYVGHPFLATMDFLGEVFLYGIYLILLLQADPGSLGVALGFGAVLFLATKFESVHMSRIFASRTRPESVERHAGFAKFAFIGAIVSFVLIGGSLPVAGKARATLERDLDHPAAADGWHGSRNRSEWTAFATSASARSQWSHDGGLNLTLFAHPQGFMSSPDDIHTEMRNTFREQGATIIADDEDVPAPFKGFRIVGFVTAKNGETIALINYFVVDAENHDVHQAMAAVLKGNDAVAEKLVREFLAGSRFIPATAPTGGEPAAAQPGT
jgi:hypothetical protein